jgi:nickel-type superoxide dismutase maturation protease
MAVAAAAAALRRLDAVEVVGRSMAPALLPGDRLLVESWTFRRRAPRPGEVVLADDPRSPSRELTKRVAAVRDGTLDLRGDLPTSSSDSRHFGPVPASTVRWRVAARYWPPSRAGLIRHAPRTSAPLELEPLGGEPACTALGDLVVGIDAEP